MALPATDTFTAADGTALTTYSASWTLNGGGFSIYSNALCNNGSGDYAAHWNADTFNNDQYASCKITVGSSYIGPAVRVSSGSTKTYYGIYGSGSTAYMYVAVNGGWAQLGSSGSAWATNDVIRIEANGTTISSTKNGSATGMPGPVTNNSIASGYAGVTGYAGLDTTHRLDDWEGGNLGGASALTVNVSDSATVGETVTAQIAAALTVSVADTVATSTDTPTVQVTAAPGATLSVNVSDSATIQESLTFAPWFVFASTNGSSTAGTTATANVPTGTLAGDLLIAVVVVEVASATITPDDATWTQLWNTPLSTRTHTQAAFARRAGGSEPASYTFTISSGEWAAPMVAYRNAQFPTLYNTQVNNTSTADCQAPTLTTTFAASRAVWVGSSMYGTTWTAPANTVQYTERADYRTGSASGNLSVSIADVLFGTPGATGQPVGTAAAADYCVGGAIAFAPYMPVVSVTDAATISESVTVSVSVQSILSTGTLADSATIAETVTAQMAALALNVTDSATIADAPTVQVQAVTPRSVDVSDSATIAETVTAQMAALAVSVTDAATLADTPTVQVVAVGGMSVSVSDSATIGETVTAQMVALAANVTDAATLGESVTVQMAAAEGVSVTDAVAIAEQVTARMAALAASVADSATIAETTAAQMATALLVNVTDAATVTESSTVIVTVAGQMYVNVADSATIAETVTAGMALPGVSVTDSATISEQVAAAAQLAGVNVTDSATLTDVPTLAAALAGVSVADAATISEQVTAALGTLLVSLADSATIAEQVTVTVSATADFSVNVSDSITAADTVQTAAMVLPGVSLTDAAVIAESANVLVQVEGVLYVNVNDDVTAADAVLVGPLGLALSTGDAAGIAETCGLTMALAGVSVVEVVTAADVLVAYVMAVAHADWSVTDAAVNGWTFQVGRVWGWTLGDAVVNSWSVSDRSKS